MNAVCKIIEYYKNCNIDNEFINIVEDGTCFTDNYYTLQNGLITT